MGEGIAYFRWRTLMLQKYGPAYFTEGGAMGTWRLLQSYHTDLVRATRNLSALLEDL